MAKMNFGGVEENVMTREEFPLEKAREILKDETIAVIGYGVQGPGQSLNLRDNGFNVIVGQREGKTYQKAVNDGWVPGKTLFSIDEACQKATIIMCLLSDAAVMSVWPKIKQYLTAGKALYFSHGFAITWNDRTGCVPPADIDVIMVAPKGSGTSLRTMFLEGRGLNSSYAVYQDYTGKAMDRTLALGIGIGSGYLFETTFQREATSDSPASVVRLWAQSKACSSLSTKYCASTVIRLLRHSTRLLRNSLSRLCPSSQRTVWIGCTPTVLPPHSAARWIGSRGSTTL
jgi:ketol-acid reductoisomerase